jgi:hypothetical protein
MKMNPQYNPELFVGIDVSKTNLDVAIGQTGETWQAANISGGIQATVKRLQTYTPQLIVVEINRWLGKALSQGSTVRGLTGCSDPSWTSAEVCCWDWLAGENGSHRCAIIGLVCFRRTSLSQTYSQSGL